MIREGSRVSFLAPEGQADVAIGDTGRALQVSGSNVYVLWTTGVAKDRITLEHSYDLGTLGRMQPEQDDLVDSLEVGSLVSTGVREIYDAEGASGLLNAMAESGHLAAFQDIAADVLSLIESRLRVDPSFRAVASSLEEDEGDSLLRTASLALLRDAFVVEVE